MNTIKIKTVTIQTKMTAITRRTTMTLVTGNGEKDTSKTRLAFFWMEGKQAKLPLPFFPATSRNSIFTPWRMLWHRISRVRPVSFLTKRGTFISSRYKKLRERMIAELRSCILSLSSSKIQRIVRRLGQAREPCDHC